MTGNVTRAQGGRSLTGLFFPAASDQTVTVQYMAGRPVYTRVAREDRVVG